MDDQNKTNGKQNRRRSMKQIAVQVNKAAQKTIDRHNRYGRLRCQFSTAPAPNAPPVRESVWARDDWYEKNGFVHVSIYGKGAIEKGTRADSDGQKLRVTVVHAFGAEETVKQYNLWAEIVPNKSVMLITENKVELVLKQLRRFKWSKLCYDGEICCAAATEDGDGGAAHMVRVLWRYMTKCPPPTTKCPTDKVFYQRDLDSFTLMGHFVAPCWAYNYRKIPKGFFCHFWNIY